MLFRSERLKKELEAANKDKAFYEGKLNNAGFVAKAPEAVVNQQREFLSKTLDKISSLINERENYKELYFKNKEELDRLKDKDSCYLTISMLAEQLKEAHAKQDYLESQNLILKESLKTIEDQRDSYRKLAESFADLCRPAPVDLSPYVKPRYEKLYKGRLILNCGEYNEYKELGLIVSDENRIDIDRINLGNIEYDYTIDDFSLKNFDTHYCVFRQDIPFLRIDKVTRKVIIL